MVGMSVIVVVVVGVGIGIVVAAATAAVDDDDDVQTACESTHSEHIKNYDAKMYLANYFLV